MEQSCDSMRPAVLYKMSCVQTSLKCMCHTAATATAAALTADCCCCYPVTEWLLVITDEPQFCYNEVWSMQALGL